MLTLRRRRRRRGACAPSPPRCGPRRRPRSPPRRPTAPPGHPPQCHRSTPGRPTRLWARFNPQWSPAGLAVCQVCCAERMCRCCLWPPHVHPFFISNRLKERRCGSSPSGVVCLRVKVQIERCGICPWITKASYLLRSWAHGCPLPPLRPAAGARSPPAAPAPPPRTKAPAPGCWAAAADQTACNTASIILEFVLYTKADAMDAMFAHNSMQQAAQA